MNELLNKLSEILGMSTDKIIESYPILRDQYVKIGALKSLNIGMEVISIMVTIFFMAAILFDKEDSKWQYKTKYIGITLIILLIIGLILKHILLILAPDLMFIESILDSLYCIQ